MEAYSPKICDADAARYFYLIHELPLSYSRFIGHPPDNGYQRGYLVENRGRS
jgi:hypothetical protein